MTVLEVVAYTCTYLILHLLGARVARVQLISCGCGTSNQYFCGTNVWDRKCSIKGIVLSCLGFWSAVWEVRVTNIKTEQGVPTFLCWSINLCSALKVALLFKVLVSGNELSCSAQ